MEERFLLSATAALGDQPANVLHLLKSLGSFQAVRPNTPVLPFGATSSVASFIDTTARIIHGQHVLVGLKSFVGPYTTLNATSGFIKIGNASDVLDNATILSNPNHQVPTTDVFIGDNVSIGYGATVLGPSSVGGYGPTSAPASVGSNALIDGGIVQPGAIVSALARVGPGVTVPTGMRVLPGKNVTTDAEASNPALGFVVPVTAADLTTLKQVLSNNQALAAGYTQLYQGNSATGASPGVPASVTGVNNGYLPAVEGAGPQPGTANASFEPNSRPPAFAGPHGVLIQAALFNFPARMTGQANFHARAGQVAHNLGRSNAIRADQGQPITFGSAPQTGAAVTVNSPLGGTVAIGQNLQAQAGSVILGGANVTMTVGNNVTIGAGAVIDRSSLGSGTTVGARAYISNSTLPAGSVVPPGAIIINNVHMGTVQW
jgi:carbonic anhydrase/acetyltransferase-like protein (isoleucine patch superfamily)